MARKAFIARFKPLFLPLCPLHFVNFYDLSLDGASGNLTIIPTFLISIFFRLGIIIFTWADNLTLI